MEPVSRDIIHRTPGPPSVQQSLRRIALGMSQIARDHVFLARMEIRQDLRKMARDAALVGVAAPLLAAGYLLLNVAIAALFASWLGAAAAFALVGGVNLVAGFVLLSTRVKRLRTEDTLQLDAVRGELRRDKEWLNDVRSRPAPTSAGRAVH